MRKLCIHCYGNTPKYIGENINCETMYSMPLLVWETKEKYGYICKYTQLLKAVALQKEKWVAGARI